MKRFFGPLVVAGSLAFSGGSAQAAVYNYGMCVKRDAVDPSAGQYGPRTVSASGQDNSGAATATAASGGQSQFSYVCTGEVHR